MAVKRLRIIRIMLAVIILVAAGMLLTQTASGTPFRVVEALQIVPSQLGRALSATLGTALFWLLQTLLFGRIYCAAFCPVGTLTELAAKLRHVIPSRRNRPYRFEPARRVRINVFWIYVITLVIAQMTVAYLIEPWNVLRNILSPISSSTVATTWLALGAPAFVAIIIGAVSLLGLVCWSALSGREFCTSICPIGTALGEVSKHSLTAISIDPDRCTGCMRCEDVCPAKCVKVVSRYVDNSRCLRCFDCMAACPEKAIEFGTNRYRPATPLMRKTKC